MKPILTLPLALVASLWSPVQADGPLFALLQAQPSASTRPPAPKNSEPVTPEVKKEVLDRVERTLTRNAFVAGTDFDKWPEVLAKRKAEIDAADTHGKFGALINDALREFGVSHVQLFTPEQAQARVTRQQTGYGFRLEFIPEGAKIVDLVAGAPAVEAGLQVGDVIFDANGKLPKSPNDLVVADDQKATFKVKRGDKTLEFLVGRRAFSTAIPETLKWPKPDIAVLKVPTFDLAYQRKNVDDLMDQAAKAKVLIVDLRGNGGGAVINLLHLSGRLLTPEQPLGTFLSRSSVDRYKEETGKDAKDLKAIADWLKPNVVPIRTPKERFQGKVAVLVNGGTGSAAEMLAAALKEQLGAPVFGTKSYGAVLASLIQPVGNGYQMLYPITEYITFKGVRLEGTGVRPDVEARTPRPNEDDPGVSAAIAWFEKVTR